MNDRQRKILITVAALIGLMLLYPPFQIMGRGLGYSWIFSPPYDAATINVGQLLMQWIAVALIGGIAFLLSKESQAAQSAVQEITTSAMPVDTENTVQPSGNPLYETFVGEKARDHYLAKFSKFDEQPTELIAGWNWSAFLCGGVWALYRKMYGWFFAFWALAVFSNIVSKASPVFGLLVSFATWAAFTAYADALYYRHVKNKIAASAHLNDPSVLLEHLRKKGGVNTWVILVFGLLPVVGILAAVLIPVFARHN